jgi:hypothetical protein
LPVRFVNREGLCAHCDLPRNGIDRWHDRNCCRIQT